MAEIVDATTIEAATDSKMEANKAPVEPENLPEIFVRGLNKNITREEVIAHFSSLAPTGIKELKWTSEPKGERTGYCIIAYHEFRTAMQAVQTFRHTTLQGTLMTVRLQSDRDQEYYFTATSPLIPRTIKVINEQERNLLLKKGRNQASVSYARDSLMVNGVEFPTPTGAYIRKMLYMRHECTPIEVPLFDIILDNKFGSRHAKELSESMAVVNALWKLGILVNISWPDVSARRKVTCYVPGDGQVPFTALILALYMPKTWKFVSIDPIMDFKPSEALLGHYADNIEVHAAMSQDYIIPTGSSSSSNRSSGAASSLDMAQQQKAAASAASASTAKDEVTSIAKAMANASFDTSANGDDSPINIVIACHSHAPLQEFWDRLPKNCPKFAITLPCCKAAWSALTDTPICEYEDYEVFSPKRRVYIYRKDKSE